MQDIRSAHFRFSRRIKLQYFFHDKGTTNVSNKFPIESDWLPPNEEMHPDILEILHELKTNLAKLPRRNKMTKLAKFEHGILRQLSTDHSVIFKPADKGQSIVIQNKQNYMLEANRQLSVALHYKPLNQPIGHIPNQKVNEILKYLKDKKFINKKEYNYCLIPLEGNRQRFIYFTPKIHKPRHSWLRPNVPKARPIISDCGSDRYRLSLLLDYYLTPLSNRHKSYLKDTPDFISKISKLKPPENFFFFSLDVESLYTNICPDAALSAVKSLMVKYPDPSRPDEQVLELLEICLRNNEFTFDSKLLLQLFGFAMGFRSAPKLADIYASKLEETVLAKSKSKPFSWLRFLDDIFGIYQHSLAEFKQLLEQLNSYTPAIKFTATIDPQEIVFLDTRVFKGNNYSLNNVLDIKVNFKVTDTHSLLHFDSYHPPACFKGILKSQILRFRRICNNMEDTHHAIDTLFNVLHTRGYPKRLTSTIRKSTLENFDPKFNGTISNCANNRCILHNNYLVLDNKIMDHNQNPIPTVGHLNCDTTNVIYAITCNICQMKYVGQTKNSVKSRVHAHTSSIRCRRRTTLAVHINQCIQLTKYSLDIAPISVTILEQVKHNTDDTVNLLELLRAETTWMKKLQTISPQGINSIKDATNPIPFILTYNDHTPKFAALIHKTFKQIQSKFPKIFRNQIVFANKRSKNIKEYIISTKLR